MANADKFLIGGNDEHGLNPPTLGKRTPVMPYINRSFYENEFNRPAKYYFLIACLRTGFNVYDVKPEMNDVSISERVRRVNAARLDAVLTYAYNAAGNDTQFSSARGQQVFYSRENRYSADSRLLSYDVSAGLSMTTGLYNRGVSTLAGIGMLRSVNCPAALPECGFMTNFEEAKLMVDPDFQKQCGDGGCLGVCEHFDVDYTESVDYSSLPTIRRGNRGTAVQLLQCYLNVYGSALTPDGVFGANTQAAVEKFQAENGLSVDGIVGKNTWQTLLMQKPLPLLKQGSRGVFVRYLQQKLLSKLYLADKVDGIFGAKTLAAVKEFQTENDLAADGIVGPLTWAKLTPVGGGRPLNR
ncbi:MAG: hypothetical protein DBX59_03695 [Bacillota bacterium]|nr:MAG: hypothetical protein DBX59_03695 [Bacillota bacterium]